MGKRVGIWRHYLDAHPEYLARHYWWAYLSRMGAWFFDHQPVINAILFGQYRKLSDAALNACLTNRPRGRFLQLTCVYGNLTTKLLRAIDTGLHLTDVASLQLALAKRKAGPVSQGSLYEARMNVEYLGYQDDAFATILVFFLLHELPSDARSRVISELLRVLRPGGRLVIAEYGMHPVHHLLWRMRLTRAVILRLEPFLDSFWRQDLEGLLKKHAQSCGKKIKLVDTFQCFDGFYRVCVFELQERSQE